ncbi:MAG: NADH-quinone oxidoreductase subunit M [Planctomycetes bacterium]|jgi:NADH-quinone oxidoreductase subunit M|nr:NADH-quinone oxidoreductase subunit M [Planctomycetota bacterium]
MQPTTLIILAPALTVLALFFLPANRPWLIRWFAVAGAFATVVLSVTMWLNYDKAAGGWQFAEYVPWVEDLGIAWNVGADGISIAMLLLTSFVIFAGALVSFRIQDRVKEFYILLLALVTGVFGVFANRDIFFFYFSYELAVIPMYLLIGVWGSTNKEYATMKLTLYLTAGAVVALVGLLLMYFGARDFYLQNPSMLAGFLSEHPEFAGSKAWSFNLVQVIWAAQHGAFSETFQFWVFPLILVGFAAIAPMWPLHTWSPGGHAAAPSAASMLHAGVLMKLGSYGIIRIGLTCLPEGAVQILPWVAALSMMNIIYGGMVAMAQRDLKFIIGYSSSSHMGYVLLGVASMNVIGLNGAVFLMFAHGIMTALAFSLIGWFYDQTHTRELQDLGGLIKQIPFVGTAFAIMAFASAGLPGFANFASELMVLFGSWQATLPVQVGAVTIPGNPWFYLYAILAVWGIVITATYLLRAVRWAFFGPLNPAWAGRVKDADGFLWKLPFVFLIVALVAFGCYPKMLVDVIGTGVEPIVDALTKARATLLAGR